MEKYQLRGDIPKKASKNLSNYPEILQKLLFYRGIETKEDAEKFLNPEYERDTHDPYLLKDIKKAAKRTLEAIEKEEKVLIYSDYDADGIPGAVILHDFFKKIGYENFENHIPKRNDDGFGLNIEAIEEAGKGGFNLIITVDCGITGVKEVERANQLGIDVIITDHHLPGDVTPKAHAIVNPNQKGDKYPFKGLCGASVAFKLVQVLIKEGDFNVKDGWDKWLLDMVGLATVSDMVPLTGENRALSYYGLVVLRKTLRPGLKSLYRETFIKTKQLNEDDISFVIAPRINAASRMNDAHAAFDLLRTKDEAEAQEGAKKLTDLNNKRKILTATITKSIKSNLAKKENLPDVIVTGNPKWVPSILGLVAGSLAESFNKPVFLWGRNGGDEIQGSCRSDQRVDVYELMKSLPEGVLVHFGGHKFSGGFGVSNNKIHFLEEEILKVHEGLNLSDEEESIEVDGELKLSDVDWNFSQELLKLAPYGKGNQKPTFLFKNVLPTEIQKFGKNKEHLKIIFSKDLKKALQAISFFSNEDSFSRQIKEGKSFDLVAFVEVSYFRNFPEIRLRIVDIV